MLFFVRILLLHSKITTDFLTAIKNVCLRSFLCLLMLFNFFCDIQTEPVQNRVYKSLKLWSMYADLEESFGTFKVNLQNIVVKNKNTVHVFT
jgi:hypothetical protein